MTTEHKPHSDHLPIYYGIHDALRELGDADADVGDTEAPPREAVISGLWDADSALSRLVEQLEALRGALDKHHRVGYELKWGERCDICATSKITEGSKDDSQADLSTGNSQAEDGGVRRSPAESGASLEEQLEASERGRSSAEARAAVHEVAVERLEEQVQSLEREAEIQNDEAERLNEQYQTALDRLWEAHDQLCGCDKPADEGRCSAPEETWGAFEYLGERERDSIPASRQGALDEETMDDLRRAAEESDDDAVDYDELRRQRKSAPVLRNEPEPMDRADGAIPQGETGAA